MCTCSPRRLVAKRGLCSRFFFFFHYYSKHHRRRRRGIVTRAVVAIRHPRTERFCARAVVVLRNLFFFCRLRCGKKKTARALLNEMSSERDVLVRKETLRGDRVFCVRRTNRRKRKKPDTRKGRERTIHAGEELQAQADRFSV